MLVITLNELADVTTLDQSIVVFPYDAPRSARTGDPQMHDLRSGIELLYLAVQVLTLRLGEPDFPSSTTETPRDWVDGALAVFAWDFDYDQLVVELREAEAAQYAVRVRRRIPPGPKDR